jgi:hypothetical protein
MNFLSEILLFFKVLFNPFEYTKYLQEFNKKIERDLKRRQQYLNSYIQSYNTLKQTAKLNRIPEFCYKHAGIGNIWEYSTTHYGYNPKKTTKRRAKNKLKSKYK